MKPGEIVLIRFPQADLEAGKLRPALARLASVEEGVINARLSKIATARLNRIKKRLADWLKQ